MIKEALFFDILPDNVVICRLCPALCRITENNYGICQCRKNESGKLVTENYGELVSLAVDPIEKKPLYHFYPNSSILSTGANGCNFRCLNCQNWTISQQKVPTKYVSPEQLVSMARKEDSIGVAFTYTEPMIWYEYVTDCANLLKKADLKVVLVSNGYVNPEPLSRLLPLIDAINVDLKGMRPDFYTEICKGQLEPVLNSIGTIAESDVHLEITNLVIPGKNDSDEDINSLVNFISSLSNMIPLHFSAYRPEHKMNIPSTPADTLLRAKSIAQQRLKYVFLGNVALEGESDSFCPECGKCLIERSYYRTNIRSLENGNCSSCGAETGIIQ